MRNAWKEALGDPATFLKNVRELAQKFALLVNEEGFGLNEIRAFVKSRNYELSNEPEVFQAVVAAFVTLLTDQHSQQLRAHGILRQTLVVESQAFRCDLLDLFHRCVFEGLDLSSVAS